jgi:hypothetical protein
MTVEFYGFPADCPMAVLQRRHWIKKQTALSLWRGLRIEMRWDRRSRVR